MTARGPSQEVTRRVGEMAEEVAADLKARGDSVDSTIALPLAITTGNEALALLIAEALADCDRKTVEGALTFAAQTLVEAVALTLRIRAGDKRAQQGLDAAVKRPV